MSEQQKYVAFDDNGNVRNLTDDALGDATVVDPGNGTGKTTAISSWKPWAFTAGGGMLGYWLANQLFGDDEEDEVSGKRRKSSFLGKLAPYLGAIAGGLGGYYLSTPSGGKGRADEIAVPVDSSGRAVIPEKPMKGRFLHGAGTAALVGGAGLGARAYARYRLGLPENLTNQANENLRAANLPGYDPVQVKALRDEAKLLTGKALKMYNGRNSGTLMSKVRSALLSAGKGKRMGGKASALGALVALLTGTGAHVLGGRMDENARNVGKVLEMMGEKK